MKTLGKGEAVTDKFRYSDDNKRYHTLSYHNRRFFGEKVYKAVIDAGFTCPNIDGTKGTGGCIFCSGGSGYFTKGSIPVREQVKSELARIRVKAPDAKAIAYFQANTNTYSDIDTLRDLYSQALEFPDIVGLSIATRVDCLDGDIADCLCEFRDRTALTVELGLQSVFDETARKINRCYDFSEFEKAFSELKSRNIRTCVHIIDGLPDEDREMMIKTAEVLGKMRPDAVKIQRLHIIRGTRAEQLYNQKLLPVLTREQYVDIVCEQLTCFPPETVIERVTGDGDRKNLCAPMWSCDKIAVLGAIDKTMSDRNIYQGDNFKD